jgi:hypothetical protein
VEHTADECFGPTWAKVKHKAQKERQIAALFQSRLIGPPVADAVTRAWDAITMTGVESEPDDPAVPI